MLGADGAGERQPDRRPHRVASADPFRQLEAARRVDAELSGGGQIVAHREEVPAGLLRTHCRGYPGTRGAGVGQGLLGGESLGGEHEQGFVRVSAAQRVGQFRRVDVGDIGDAQVVAGVAAEGARGHARPEVRAADAEVDDAADRHAAGARHFAAADRLRQFGDPRPRRAHPVRDRNAGHGVVALRPQRDVQHGAALGEVDQLAARHACDAAGKIALLRQLRQQSDGFGDDVLLGKIHQEVVQTRRQTVEALRVGSEHLPHRARCDGVAVLLQSAPCLALCESHFQSLR